jgi:GTP cyclohydrolase I
MDEERVKKLVRELIIEVGEDPTREGLRETPERIANMYKEIFGGYDSDSELSVQFSDMLPFYGKIHIAYSPNGRVFGISKLVRLVEKYSKRLQIQERLTKNIADELHSQGVKGVVVLADAEHLCMKMRGVRNDATLSSSAFRGIYENKEEKAGIMSLIRQRGSDLSL